MRDVVIVGAARTPIGSFGGALSSVSAPRLGAVAIQAAVERSKVSPNWIDEVIMGCVLTAGVGQAPARQAALFAELPRSVPCMTINKVCGSGLKAVMLAAQSIRAGDARVVVAGGMENMSQVPHLLPGSRDGYRLGHQQVVDGMIKDGLWDVYNDFHMGNAAELCVREHGLTREAQDAFAASSYEKALAAQSNGLFDAEIAPVNVPQRRGDAVVVTQDEEPGRGRPEKLGKLRGAFERDGTVTAGNASSINDGAACVVLADAQFAEENQLPVLAKISATAQHAQDPEWFSTAPAFAMRKIFEKAGLSPKDIDLYEVNEAFAAVSLACNQLAELPEERVNVHGGAVSLGHPIGASGARILVTLLHAMQAQEASRGLASLCIGGGEAVALLVER